LSRELRREANRKEQNKLIGIFVLDMPCPGSCSDLKPSGWPQMLYLKVFHRQGDTTSKGRGFPQSTRPPDLEMLADYMVDLDRANLRGNILYEVRDF
jgi:hypothetical protein